MVKTFTQKCEEKCDRLVNSMIHTNQTYFTLMQMRELQWDYNDIINISPAFFNTVIRNCMEVLYIEIDKMFDSSGRSLGIRRLVDTVEKEIHQVDNGKKISVNFFSGLEFSDMEKSSVVNFDNISDLIGFAKKEFENHSQAIQSIKKQRNKYYAHLDGDLQDVSKFFEENKVTYVDMEQLLLLNSNLTNSFYVFFKNSIVLPLSANCNDFNALLKRELLDAIKRDQL